ncbi:MAG TPA: hypothetical protein PKA63_06800 [Oligoflexia bacterium]|nr:hypothetical protein [Oligoflexia bacterium]HMP48358.1 hypothetical protein [Oligoflexia bacterium]
MIIETHSDQFKNQNGLALFSVITAIAVILVLISTYHTITRIELSSNYASIASKLGFFSAEAGLNLRASEIREKFLGYNRPSGTSPDSTGACKSGNNGSGDFSCKSFTLPDSKHSSISYIEEEPGNPLMLSIPPGELYQGLNAQEYRYSAISQGIGPKNQVEAILELKFKSRLVPLFQFAAFYNKDLEILPGPSMTLAGPVHTNGQLYLNSGNQLSIDGQVTAAKDIFRGRKNTSVCDSKNVRIKDPNNYKTLLNPCATRTLVTEAMLAPWNGMINSNVTPIEVPSADILLPSQNSIYWTKADARIILSLKPDNTVETTNSSLGVEVRNADNTINAPGTLFLENCAGSIGENPANSNNGKSIGNTNAFRNNRENRTIRMLEIDMGNFLSCARDSSFFGAGKTLGDDTEGGLVIYLSVMGPNSNLAPSGYGVRIRNAAQIAPHSGFSEPVKGITLVSDQAVYLMGHFNSVGKKPAAVLADTINILSTAWGTNDAKSNQALGNRIANHTTINSAFLAGTDTTGGVEGSGGQGGSYNGGLENYPRLHENWTGRTLTYYGSFVSLGTPSRSNGPWVYGGMQYEAPNRDWHYDTDFNDAANLPPITPRFVYLKQQLFHRNFDQQ